MSRDAYALSTGRVIAANRGILGIAPDGVYEGYDGVVECSINAWAGSDHVALTPAERRELADIAISMWDVYAVMGPKP